MKNIFELEEGCTYQVEGQHRKFRVNKGQLENDGAGRFAPCDWAPLNAQTVFKKTSSTQGFISKTLNKTLALLSSLFNRNSLSLLQLKEGVIYKSTSLFLPTLVCRQGSKLVNFETKEEIKLKKLSLFTRFTPVSEKKPLLPRRFFKKTKEEKEKVSAL